MVVETPVVFPNGSIMLSGLFVRNTPSVATRQIGVWPASPSPFVIMHGPYGYHIQFLGVTETAAITKECEEMLGTLCAIKSVWCLPK